MRLRATTRGARVNWRGATLTVSLLAFVLVAGSCSADSGGDATATRAAETLAYKLAVVDGVSGVAPGDSSVARYQSALDVTGRACPGNTEQQLADMSVKATQILASNYGISATALDMLQGVSSSLAGTGLEPSDCTETLTLLIVLMGEG